MNIWARFPFLRICFVLILGILTGRYFYIAPENLLHLQCITMGLFILILLSKFFYKIRKIFVHHSIWGNLFLVIVFLVGLIRYESYDLSEHLLVQAEKIQKCSAYEAVVTSYPERKNGRVIYEIGVVNGINDTAVFSMKSQMILTEKVNTESVPSLKYGDKFFVNSTPKQIRSPVNPHNFDYSVYRAKQNIFFQDYVKPDQIHLISSSNGNGIMTAVYQIRNRFEGTIISNIPSPSEQGIVLALLLGIKGRLDSEIKSSYAATGAMHVLAVSGLHVAIILILLKSIFKIIPSHYFKKHIAPIVSIVALWIYALLTGFSPSILRAVTMFSIIIMGKSMNRKTNIFNSLALAAFLLLVFNPAFIFSIGFQLSFLAVCGIVYIHPLLQPLLNPKNVILKLAWSMSCISIAAQITTFPLSIYYFHQFPTYFLLSNIIVILAAYTIMAVGILMLMFSATSIGSFFGDLLSGVVSCLNQFVKLMYQAKGSVLDWLFITSSQLLMIYLLILSAFALLYFRKIKYAWMMLFAVIFISTERSITLYQQSQKEQLTFYSMRNHNVMDYIVGLKANLLSLDSMTDFNRIKYQVNPNRLYNHLPPVTSPTIINTRIDSIFHFAHLKVFQGKRFLYLSESFDLEDIKYMVETDVLIISHNAVKSLEKIKEVISFEKVILDSTNDFFYIKKIEKQAIKLKIAAINVNSKAVSWSAL